MKLLIDNLTCVRGQKTVFSELSFKLSSGEGLLLHGPNGSGKTSLLRSVCGFIQPHEGSIKLEGGDDEQSLGEQCHFIGHQDGIKHSFTVLENLEFWSVYFDGKSPQSALERLRLNELRDFPAKYLSAGQKRRLGLARLVISERPIWLLDEPTVSLDHTAQTLLAGIVEEHIANSGLVIAATHVPLGIELSKTLTLGERGLDK